MIDVKKSQALFSTTRFIACFEQAYPATKGHVVIYPNTHLTFDDLVGTDMAQMYALADMVMEFLRNRFGATGFNVGMDIGASAGQLIDCATMHVIPRYDNDNTLRGGMRAVAPIRPSPGLGNSKDDWR